MDHMGTVFFSGAPKYQTCMFHWFVTYPRTMFHKHTRNICGNIPRMQTRRVWSLILRNMHITGGLIDTLSFTSFDCFEQFLVFAFPYCCLLSYVTNHVNLLQSHRFLLILVGSGWFIATIVFIASYHYSLAYSPYCS